MESAKAAVKRTLTDAKEYLAQESPRRISEADTKANFIEPIISALGWEGIGVVTREYYVRDSREFIDFVMSDTRGPLLAIEAKPLLSPLTDKNAAQLIQYCAVEGIEWAALTNGQELQFFNTFIRPDLAAKRILSLDLLAFNTDAEYESLFENLWQLSRESMTTPTGVRTWLNQRRLERTLRDAVTTPGSAIVQQLQEILNNAEIIATPQDIAQWFRSHLGTSSTSMPIPATIPKERTLTDSSSDDTQRPSSSTPVSKQAEPASESVFNQLRYQISNQWPDTEWRTTKHYVAASVAGQTFLAVKFRTRKLVLGLNLPANRFSARTRANRRVFNWRRISRIVDISSAENIDQELLELIGFARCHSQQADRGRAHYGVQVRELVDAGLLAPGTTIILTAGSRDITTASISESGEIIWRDGVYRSLSDKVFAPLLGEGRSTLNGWNHWVVDRPSGRVPLAEVRREFIARQR